MIRLDNVTKIYKGETRAVDGVSLDIKKGEFVFLVGESGSGKSTMLRLVTAEEPATTGPVHVAGKDLSRMSSGRVPYLRRNIGSVFQDFKLLPQKTVYENVAFALQVIGRPKNIVTTQVPAILDLVGLSHKQKSFPDELSGGEQQRVAVARAMINGPRIIFADEPSGNLDSESAAALHDLLFNLREKTGTALVLVTHNDTLAQRADRIITLKDGQIIS